MLGFFTRRMASGALVLALYGIWVALACVPHDLTPATRILASVWAVGLFAGIGALIAPIVAIIAMSASRPLPLRLRPAVAATIETLLVLPLLAWLILNEFVYAVTCEVLGRETLMMIWSNPAAVFQNAWAMGARYLVASGALTILVAAAAQRLAAGSYRRLWPPPPLPETPHSPAVSPGRPGPLVVMGAGLLTLAILLAWQFAGHPSLALAAICRSAPPLRAFSMARVLVGMELRGSPPVQPTGSPLIADAQYQASIPAAAHRRPNVILIVLESVSATSLHCYGYERPDVTPTMDELAAGGVLFEHCWGTASFSSYGLVSVMTGLHMLRAEHNDHFSDTNFPHFSLPRAFKLAGYQTGLFSSGNESFDHISDFYPPSDFDRYYSHDTSGLANQKDCMRMDDSHAVGEFEKWLSACDPTRPFYSSFYLQSTHFDYEVPEPWANYYQPTPPLLGSGNAIIRIPPDLLQPLRNQYDNAMRYSDYWVSRIRDAIRTTGQLDNAVIAITADHGEAFMQHGQARHGVHLWEEMIRVPFIVFVGKDVRSALGLNLPGRVPDTVSGVDIAPTLAALTGLPAHPNWQGVNVLAPGYTSRDRPIFSVLQLTRWQEAVCLNDWKYIYDLTDVQPYLFDLKTDPEERANLAESRPDLAAALRDILGAWHAEQIAYYTKHQRPQTSYIGTFGPTAAQIQRLAQAAVASQPF